MKKITKIKVSFLLLFMLTFYINQAQEQIAVIQSPNILLLDATTGDIVDPSFIDLTPLDPGTPKAILQVGEELWITDQIRDRIDRFDLEGIYLGQIGGIVPDGGLDNIKGLAIVNNSEVWVTNAGSNNGAPGNSIVRFDFDGNNLGFFLVAPQSTTSFDLVDNGNGEVYISYITSNNIERRDYEGNFIANIVGPGVVSFIQQIQITQNNDLLAAVFSNTGSSGNNQGVYRFDINDGSILDYYSFSGLRGVRELGNGNILYSNSGGIHRINVATGVSTMISSGGAQFFGAVLLEECSSSPDAPTGLASQTHCVGNTVADLEVTGQNIQWYTTPTGGTSLAASEPLVSGSYYATQTVDGCESQDRFEVTVTLVSTETPAGDSPQSFEQGATLANIVITPADVTWFATEADALAGNNPLPLSTVLVDGETYYAVNIVGDCLSEPTPVTVAINLSTNDFHSSNFTFYPNPTDGMVHLVYNKSITGVTVSNLLGQIVLNKEYNSNQVEIDLSTLPNGVYLLRLNSENGIKVIKVVKK